MITRGESQSASVACRVAWRTCGFSIALFALACVLRTKNEQSPSRPEPQPSPIAHVDKRPLDSKLSANGTFSSTGLHCATEDESLSLSVKVVAMARGTWEKTLGTPLKSRVNSENAELIYAENVRERYVRRGEEYEQIIDLLTPVGTYGDLVVKTRVNTPLTYAGTRCDGALIFRKPATYRYAVISHAYAVDAVGNTTPLTMEFDKETSTYAIRVPSTWLENASYPVAIDPTISFEDLLQDETIGPWIGVLPDAEIEAITGVPVSLPLESVSPPTGGSIVLTVAGGGDVGDGPALTSAGLNAPFGIAMDSDGNVFIADVVNHRIRVHNRKPVGNLSYGGVVIKPGEVGTIAGSGTAGFSGDSGLALPAFPGQPALLNSPSHIAVDGAGNVYFDQQARIRRITPSGVITTVVGSGVPGFTGEGGIGSTAQIRGVGGMVVRGNLLIFADIANHRVRAFNIGAAAEVILGKSIAPGIVDTVLGNGIATNTGDGISALFPTGAPGEASPISISSPGFAVGGIALDSASNLYVPAFHSQVGTIQTSQVRVLNLSSVAGLTFGGTTTTTIPLNQINTVLGGGTDAFTNGIDRTATRMSITGIDVDSTGRLFWKDFFTVAPFLAIRIRRMDNMSGVVTTVSGGLLDGFEGDGGPASAALWRGRGTLRIPKTGSEANQVFSADQSNNKVRKIAGGDPTSIVESVTGTGFTGASGDDALTYTASLGRPIGVRFRSEGAPVEPRFFVADTGNNRVFQVLPGGRLDTLTGQGSAGSSGDGGPATSARLGAPFDVAFDVPGNMYIIDGRNHAVRVINRQGSPLTIGSVTIAPGNIATVAGVLGTAGFNGEGGSQLSVQLRIPTSVDLSSTTSAVYILDSRNNRLRVLNRNASPGASITVLGVAIAAGEMRTVIPGPLVGPLFFFPQKVRIEPSTQDILITDEFNNRVLRITQGGVVTVVAALGLPEGLAIRATTGEIFVGSRTTDQIFKIVGAAVTTFAGDGIQRFAGDGGQAGPASFFDPIALDIEEVSGDFRLYIADQSNNRIRRIQPEEAPPFGVLPAGTYSPIPGVTISTSLPATTGPASGFFSVTASTVGPPAPADFRLGPASKRIYFTIEAVNLTFPLGNEFTITVFWDDEYQCGMGPGLTPPAQLRLFHCVAGCDTAAPTWAPLTSQIVDCTAKTTTGQTSSLSIIKVFEAVPVPLELAGEPEQVKNNPGVLTLSLMIPSPFTLDDLVLNSLTVNEEPPLKVLRSANKLLVKVPRTLIMDLGNGTGFLIIAADLTNGKVATGELIIALK